MGAAKIKFRHYRMGAGFSSCNLHYCLHQVADKFLEANPVFRISCHRQRLEVCEGVVVAHRRGRDITLQQLH